MRHSPVLHLVLLVVLFGASFAFAQQTVNGALADGSLYRFQIPATWNGDLVLYAHEYVDPASPVALPNDANFIAFRDSLVNQGYAVGYSSFAKNGWAVDSGFIDTLSLRYLFPLRFGVPKHVYLVGKDIGSLVVTKLEETNYRLYNGVLAMCGPMGGAQAQVNYLENARVLYDTLFVSGMFGTFGTAMPGTVSAPQTAPFAPGDPTYDGVSATLTQGITGPSTLTMDFAATAGIPNSGAADVVSGSLAALSFSARGSADLLARASGLPFDNTLTAYSDTLNTTLNTQINLDALRYVGSTIAAAYLKANYQPTGYLRVPMYTVHNSIDPVVPAWHEVLYGRQVWKSLYSHLYMVQKQTATPGHCAFTPAEQLSAFNGLVTWATTGVKP